MPAVVTRQAPGALVDLAARRAERALLRRWGPVLAAAGVVLTVTSGPVFGSAQGAYVAATDRAAVLASAHAPAELLDDAIARALAFAVRQRAASKPAPARFVRRASVAVPPVEPEDDGPADPVDLAARRAERDMRRVWGEALAALRVRTHAYGYPAVVAALNRDGYDLFAPPAARSAAIAVDARLPQAERDQLIARALAELTVERAQRS